MLSYEPRILNELIVLRLECFHLGSTIQDANIRVSILQLSIGGYNLKVLYLRGDYCVYSVAFGTIEIETFHINFWRSNLLF